MFLVPFNKKRILGSTLSSQEQKQKRKQHPANNQTIYESNYDIQASIQKSYFNPANCHHLNRPQIIQFTLGTANFLNKIFIESLASLRRCLHISLRTLLVILNSITSQCTELLIDSSAGNSSGGGGAGEGSASLDFFDDSIGLVSSQPSRICSGSPGDSTLSYLRAIAEAGNWSEAAAAAIRVAAPIARENSNETIYYETITEPPSVSAAAAATTTTTRVSEAPEAEDPYQCDTIEMDFCRRRITQRAASNHRHDAVGPPTNIASCYWDYPAPPSAASSAQTCTSVEPQVSGENKATELCRQLRREQLGPQFQGQQQKEPQQRSYGLQMEMGNCRRECPQQQQQRQQIIQLQPHQEQKLPRSIHEPQISKTSQYLNCVAQSSLVGSSPDPATFMSAHHHNLHHHQQQKQKQQDGPNGSMNFNSHVQQLQEHQEQQKHSHQLQHKALTDQQDASAEVVDGPNGASMVLVSKDTISNLTDQIALSMNKMKELEERVRVIPEMQRRLDNVISDSNSSSVSDSNHHLPYIGGRNNNSNYHNNYQSHNRQDFSFSTDNVAPYYGSGCNRYSSSANQRAINDRATYNDDIFRGIHPSLQRHYNSYRCSTNNRARDTTSCFSMKDSVIATQTTAGNFSMRSPLTGSRDFSSNNGCGTASLTNNHSNNNNNSSRQSLPVSINNSTNMLRSNQNLNTNLSSSPKVEYEDLINDLLSLSYSVNYPSSTTNSSQNQSFNTRRSNHQVKEIQASNKTSELDQQQASKRSSPSVSKLDCGCQSFKEHLRYNSISREQRMQHTRSQSVSYTSATSNIPSASLQTTPTHNKNSGNNRKDASTNTDLSMDDIVTKVELNSLVSTMQKTYSTLSSIASRDAETTPDQFRSIARKSSSLASESNSGSMSEPKSSSPQDSRSDSCDDEQVRDNDNEDDGLSDLNCGSSSNKGSLGENGNSRSQISDDEQDEVDGNHSDAGSLIGEGPYSLGSSYQDPSDFEEYCAYGESLDRRTKDFMSQSTKIPNDLRFALIRLNDFIKRNRSYEQIESSSGCIEVIRKEWFDVAANKDSQPAKTKLYVDYFESFTKQLLNTVVNLCDNAGNTAMHYAASLFKLDIIKVLLDTKVCDVNCRNKAGYTPIMLLALTDITKPEEQEIARQLFNMGDVNIKARTNGQTAIMLSASHGRISTCKLLLECGADPSLQDYDGSTALMCGSEIGDEEVVRCLLAHKLTDPNALDNDGLDALTIAMNNGHKNIGLILYAAKNVPRMVRSAASNPIYNHSSSYLGASLRRSRGKVATNYIRRADSLLGSRSSRLVRHSHT